MDGFAAPAPGHAHDQAEVRDETVVGAEHRRAQVVARRHAPVPRFRCRDARTLRHARRLGMRELLHDAGVIAFFGGKAPCVGLARILVAIGILGGGERGQHETRAEQAHEPLHENGLDRWARMGPRGTTRFELARPHACMLAFRLRQFPENVLAHGIALDTSERVVERRTVQFVRQVSPIPLDFLLRSHLAAFARAATTSMVYRIGCGPAATPPPANQRLSVSVASIGSGWTVAPPDELRHSCPRAR